MTAEDDAAGTQPGGPDRDRRPVRDRSSEEREELAERIADRLDVPITAAGVVFLLLVLAETISDPQGLVGTLFSIASCSSSPSRRSASSVRSGCCGPLAWVGC